MNKYYIDVITGDGGSQGRVDYTIEADGYETFQSGYYMFYKRPEKNEIIRSLHPTRHGCIHVTVATFPIARTIITKIEEL